MSKTILSKPKMLQEAKELNIHRRNCLKTKQEPGKAVVETQRKYMDIIFDELIKQ